MPSNHLILCCPLLFLPSVFPSIRVFSSESVLHITRPKYWSFSFNISPSNEYSGLISFRIDCFDLHAVQGTFQGLLQHHSSKGSILWCSVFFTVQLSYPYMTTGKTITLTRWTFVGKGMSLLLNMLSRLVICFLPRSKHLLILRLQSPSAVILEPQKIVWHGSQCFPMYFPWSDGTRCHDLISYLFYISQSIWQYQTFSLSLSTPYKLQKVVRDREAWCATVHGVTKCQKWWLNKNNNTPCILVTMFVFYICNSFSQ